MNFKLVASFICASLASPVVAGTLVAEKEFGHWVAAKDADDFNPNIASCSVQNVGWIPATELEPEKYVDWKIRLYIDKQALTSTGTLEINKIAVFYEWDTAAKKYFIASDVYDDGKNVKMEQQVVTAKVDEEIVDFFSTSLAEQLKGKVELTYRYTAHQLPNAPVRTNSVSLIGFTQAWNYAKKLCK